MNTPKYWIVGATWGGHDDQSPKFLLRGYWILGWSDTEQPAMAALRNQISVGDRIAIKKCWVRAAKKFKSMQSE
jgi:5-methylcytosine-specific restriction protein B